MNLHIIILLSIVYCYHIAASQNAITSEWCYGKKFLMNNNGIVISHTNFSRQFYPANTICQWWIRAPMNHIIRLQTLFTNLEAESMCRFDYIEVLDFTMKLDKPMETQIPQLKALSRVCGAAQMMEYFSKGNHIRLTFRADASLNKIGFIMSYNFVNKSLLENENYRSNNNQWSHQPPLKITTNRWLSQRKTIDKCQQNEAINFQCKRVAQCIDRGNICDGKTDCVDGSDEWNCQDRMDPTMPRSEPPTCHYQLHFKCLENDQCILANKRCDGIVDCPNGGSDEKDCRPLGAVTTQPRFVNTNGQCSVVTIKPRSKSTRSPNDPIDNLLTGDDDGKIVGGIVAKPGSWPWMVSLRHNGGHVCGGSVISSGWVLTAAHCVDGGRENGAEWEAHIGRHTLYEQDRTLQRIRVSRVIKYPYYDSGTVDGDYALMELGGRVQYNDHVQPVCLPSGPSDVPRDGQRCAVTGWGDTRGTGGENYLKQAVVPIVNQRTCNSWYGGRVTSKMICAGYQQGTVDACQGDSGGPFVCRSPNGKLVQYGVVSWGDDCAAARKPGVYSNVAKILNWIRSNAQV